MKLPHKWYDHELVWEFYDHVFDKQYFNFDSFEIANWDKDVYEGIDGDVLFVNNSSNMIPTQVKTSSYPYLSSLKLSLSYTNEYGRDSAFGLYFNESRLGNIQTFMFGFPFLGVGLSVDYLAFKNIWENNFDKWVNLYNREGVGENNYISIPARNVIELLHKDDWRFIQGIGKVNPDNLR